MISKLLAKFVKDNGRVEEYGNKGENYQLRGDLNDGDKFIVNYNFPRFSFGREELMIILTEDNGSETQAEEYGKPLLNGNFHSLSRISEGGIRKTICASQDLSYAEIIFAQRAYDSIVEHVLRCALLQKLGNGKR